MATTKKKPAKKKPAKKKPAKKAVRKKPARPKRRAAAVRKREPEPTGPTRGRVVLADLEPAPYNPRSISPEALGGLAGSLKRWGLVQPIIVNARTGRIVGGHQRVKALQLDGVEEADAVFVDLPEHEEKALNLTLNSSAIAGEFTAGARSIVDELLEDTPELGGDVLMAELQKDLARMFPDERGQAKQDEAPAPPAKPKTRLGDLYTLGEHRLICGDSTDVPTVQRLLDGVAIDLVATDPPYCSGGFQESGKSSGSVGTTATHKMVANDTLSTRGYTALLKSAFHNIGSRFLYAFTDWRMWVYLFDIAESSGYGVRSMIVWDKSTPGMGRGWRAQHELILWACKQTPPFDKHAPGCGNVIQAKRTGNKLHTTEKPVELMGALLENVPFAKTVADPFAGSGTTLVACEQLDRRRFFGFELDPAYCDVIVERWENFTGKKARRHRGR